MNKLLTKRRCKWCEGDLLLENYHDNEWGIVPNTDDELFERMAMQIFQAGLNWKMILKKRPYFNKAFDKFNITRVRKYSDPEFKKLINNEKIIRNKQKISAVIHNAKVVKDIQDEYGSFLKFINDLPIKLPQIQSIMRKKFKFMGPEITRMFIFNIGKLNPPHEKQCWRYH
jgi:DNA-3-methyladenine glycosylase I